MRAVAITTVFMGQQRVINVEVDDEVDTEEEVTDMFLQNVDVFVKFKE